VIRALMAGPNRDSSKAVDIVQSLQEVRPQFLLESGLTGLEVLSRLDDEKLYPTTEKLSQKLLAEPPPHPAVLLYAAQFFEKTSRSDTAFQLLQQLADSGFEDEELTVDACIRVADHFASNDPKRARAYYWRAVQLAWASSPYGTPSAKSELALQRLNKLDQP
jgi:hypothetical protein